MSDKSAGFEPVFHRLKTILQPYESALVLKADGPANYYLDTPYAPKYGKELFFGAVQIKKNYVSYHLMPVYMYPDLLEGISPELKKRMQGKSCFNFKTVDDAQVEELALLTKQGFARVKQEALAFG
ncbi:MAG: hypothetical protein KJ077_06900 [Anaerolineae bacterium]|nr:hypothetical protein [Anaerolineae bacterium]